MKKRLVFIHSYFYPDHSAGSQMLTDLAFDLVDEGLFKVVVFTGRRVYGQAKPSLPAYEKIRNIEIWRVSSPCFNRDTLVGRAVDNLFLQISLLVSLLIRMQKGDIVIAMTEPPFINILCYPIVMIRGGRLINWLQDLFPEVAVAAGLIAKGSKINKVLIFIRNKILNRSELNIVIGSSMYDYLKSNNIKDERLVIIPNWAKDKLVMPISKEKNHMRSQYNLNHKFVVGYSGNLGKAHDVETILLAMENLKDRNRIKFLFTGGGSEMQRLKKICIERGLNNVIFKPYQKRSKLGYSLCIADVHLITLNPEMEGFIIPSKIYGILAAGRAVIFIGDKKGEVGQIINRIKCGVSVDVGDSQDLISKIKYFSKNASYTDLLGRRSREGFDKFYEASISQKKFISVLK